MRNNRYFAYTDTHKIWPEESLDSMIEAIKHRGQTAAESTLSRVF